MTAAHLNWDALESSDEDDADYVPSAAEINEAAKYENIEVVKKEGKCVNTLEKNDDPPVDEKVRADKLWKDFLKDDVSESTKDVKSDPNIVPSNQTHQKVVNNELSSSETNESNPSLETKSVLENKNDNAGKDTLLNQSKSSPMEDGPSAKPTASIQGTTSVSKKRSTGLDSVLGLLGNKKPKMTILDQSKADWNTFKRNEGIDEDLETHNKGKHGFLERQAFLTRTDFRSFEVEKFARLSKK